MAIQAGQKAYLSELENFIAAEAAAKRQEIDELRSKSLGERVALGRAVSDLRVDEEEGARRWGLSCRENDSRFREGDLVCISRTHPHDDLLARGKLVAVGDRELTIEVREGKVELGDHSLVMDEDYLDLTSRYKTALEAAATTTRGLSRILPLLMGEREPQGPSLEDLAFKQTLVREGFNAQQAEAIVYATSTDLCHLIQGPPGTGKTRVLARCVGRILERDPRARILLTSFTHRAIDNCLEAIVKARPDLEKITVKVSASPPQAELPWVRNFEDSPLAHPDTGPYLVGATPFAHETRLGHRDFDWVIVDEASQVTRPLAVMAMLAADRWIFAGDHKQLPPVTLSKRPADALAESVFGCLQSRGHCTLLNVTYRMNRQLTHWPSAEFYDGELVAHRDNAESVLTLIHPPAELTEILSPENSLVYVRLEHRGDKSASRDEVVHLCDLLLSLRQAGCGFDRVGVVVPFRRQARLLRVALLRSGVTVNELQGLTADTVERMQGQERDIVMLSLTTSDVAFADFIGEFLFQPERLNVAITRAKTKLIVLGSDAWQIFPGVVEESAAAGVFDRFLGACKVVDSWRKIR